jgi:hypothetical protein
LWREWKQGLGGGPSIECLEQQHGTKWCVGKHERRFFNRRKLIIDAVEQRAHTIAGDFTENAKVVAQMFEEKRGIIEKSIDWISKNLSVFLTQIN